MSDGFRAFTADDAVASAAAALSCAWGAAIRLDDIAMLSGEQRRNHVIRAVARGGGYDRPVVIKATRARDYDATAADAVVKNGIAREIAAGRIVAGQDAGTAGLLTCDTTAGVAVFADLGSEVPPLVEPLLRGAASDAETALTAYATGLGRLHGATAGCRDRYAAVVHAAYPGARVPQAIGDAWLAGAIHRCQSLLGGSLPEDEAELLVQRMRDPGPWLALVHCDPCPDNVLLTTEGAALLDFEFAAPGHALIDATYWRLGFPTCWCAGRVPYPVAERIDAAYRAAVSATIPAANDAATYHRDCAIAIAVRLIINLEWHLSDALQEDSVWGRATQRSRILWHLEAVVHAMQRASALPGLQRIALDWLEQLGNRWPETVPLPVYPAFAEAEES